MYLVNRNLVLVIALVLAAACTPKKKPESAEAVLQAYVTTAINAKGASDKARLYEYTTGEARQRLEAMPDEDFVNSVVKPEYKFVHFSTRDLREEKDGAISVVYELVYESTAGDNGAKITNRKIAYLKKEGDVWRISDTRNVKAFVEMKEGMNVQVP